MASQSSWNNLVSSKQYAKDVADELAHQLADVKSSVLVQDSSKLARMVESLSKNSSTQTKRTGLYDSSLSPKQKRQAQISHRSQVAREKTAQKALRSKDALMIEVDKTASSQDVLIDKTGETPVVLPDWTIHEESPISEISGTLEPATDSEWDAYATASRVAIEKALYDTGEFDVVSFADDQAQELEDIIYSIESGFHQGLTAIVSLRKQLNIQTLSSARDVYMQVEDSNDEDLRILSDNLHELLKYEDEFFMLSSYLKENPIVLDGRFSDDHIKRLDRFNEFVSRSLELYYNSGVEFQKRIGEDLASIGEINGDVQKDRSPFANYLHELDEERPEIDLKLDVEVLTDLETFFSSRDLPVFHRVPAEEYFKQLSKESISELQESDQTSSKPDATYELFSTTSETDNTQPATAIFGSSQARQEVPTATFAQTTPSLFEGKTAVKKENAVKLNVDSLPKDRFARLKNFANRLAGTPRKLGAIVVSAVVLIAGSAAWASQGNDTSQAQESDSPVTSIYRRTVTNEVQDTTTTTVAPSSTTSVENLVPTADTAQPENVPVATTADSISEVQAPVSAKKISSPDQKAKKSSTRKVRPGRNSTSGVNTPQVQAVVPSTPSTSINQPSVNPSSIGDTPVADQVDTTEIVTPGSNNGGSGIDDVVVTPDNNTVDVVPGNTANVPTPSTTTTVGDNIAGKFAGDISTDKDTVGKVDASLSDVKLTPERNIPVNTGVEKASVEVRLGDTPQESVVIITPGRSL